MVTNIRDAEVPGVMVRNESWVYADFAHPALFLGEVFGVGVALPLGFFALLLFLFGFGLEVIVFFWATSLSGLTIIVDPWTLPIWCWGRAGLGVEEEGAGDIGWHEWPLCVVSF